MVCGFLCNSCALFLPLLKAGENLRVNLSETSRRLRGRTRTRPCLNLGSIRQITPKWLVVGSIYIASICSYSLRESSGQNLFWRQFHVRNRGGAVSVVMDAIVGKPSVWILPRKKLRLSCAIRMLSTLHLLYFSWDMKHAIRATWLASPNRDRSSHLPHNFWSSYEYLIYYHRSEDSLAHLVVIQVPNPLNLEWVVNFELCSPISCKHMFFCCPFLGSHLNL